MTDIKKVINKYSLKIETISQGDDEKIKLQRLGQVGDSAAKADMSVAPAESESIFNIRPAQRSIVPAAIERSPQITAQNFFIFLA